MSPRPMANRWALNCLVFVTGAAVMILEVLGTRIIGPYFGVSLFVWTALILVTLVALAGGYYCGGALADLHPGYQLTPAVTLAAATVILLIPVLTPWVLPLTNSWGVRLGTLVAAAVLFGPPLFLLAMVVPSAVKVRTVHLEQVGLSVGSLYGISTVGSCLGTLLAAYVLIPSIRTYSILHLASMCLAAAAGLHLLTARRSRDAIAAGAVVAIGLIRLMTSAHTATEEEGDIRVLFRADSVYGKVQVVDDALHGVRWLMSDCSVVGAEYLEGKATFYPFLRMIEAVRFLNPSGTKALAIGLGTGAVPKLLAASGIRSDIVEIDPNVVRAATEFFGFEPNGELYIEDGRRFLKRAEQQYDFIVHDTFTGGAVPFHLLSRQVFEDTRRSLKREGVLCLVFVGYFSGDRALAVRSVFKTLSQVYPHVRVIADPNDPSTPSNLLFFASGEPLNWSPAEWTGLSETVRGSLEKQQKTFISSQGVVITDELNPLDLWQMDKSEIYRKWILEQFPTDVLID